jgi:hypothetical protein
MKTVESLKNRITGNNTIIVQNEDGFIGENKIIELVVEHSLLRLEIVNELKWCRVYHITDKTYELGAGSLETICGRFLIYLNNYPLNNTQTLEPKYRELTWITSLSEKHFSFWVDR